MFGLIPYSARLTSRDSMKNYLNPFSDDFFRAFFGSAQESRMLKVDVCDKGDHYLLEADLPGVKKEDVRVSIDEGILTIAADVKEEKEEKEENYVCRERRFGRMCRSFRLDGVNDTGIKAAYKDGVLSLSIPKVTETAPPAREIEIE